MTSESDENTLAALKTLKAYNATYVQYVMAETNFASEKEAALALYIHDWDIDRAIESLLYAK